MAKSDGDLFGLAFVLFFVGLFLIYKGAKNYLLKQKIENIPTSTVHSASIGLVELFGRAEFDKPTQSPVSGVDCAYWRLKGEYYQSGENGGWREI